MITEWSLNHNVDLESLLENYLQENNISMSIPEDQMTNDTAFIQASMEQLASYIQIILSNEDNPMYVTFDRVPDKLSSSRNPSNSRKSKKYDKNVLNRNIWQIMGVSVRHDRGYPSDSVSYIEGNVLDRDIPGYDDFDVDGNGNIRDRYVFNYNVALPYMTASFQYKLVYTSKYDYKIAIENSPDHIYNSDIIVNCPRVMEFYTPIDDNAFVLSDIQAMIQSLETNIAHKEEEIDDIKSELENYKWIESYMKENKIVSEKKDIVKSKMILKQLDLSKEESENITQISELLSMKI